MIQCRSLAAATAAAGLLAATPAAAVIKIATYTGTVSGGYDTTGVFGAADTDLTGASWVATYTYDKTLGGYQFTDGVSYDQSYGGATDGNGSPILSASITINGVTKTIAGTYFGYAYTDIDSLVEHQAFDRLFDGVTYSYNVAVNFANPAGSPASLDQNFGPVAPDGSDGSFSWYTYDYSTNTLVEYAYANLDNTSVYLVGNAVPEPAAWALMVAGFGMVGLAVRRRWAAVTA